MQDQDQMHGQEHTAGVASRTDAATAQAELCAWLPTGGVERVMDGVYAGLLDREMDGVREDDDGEYRQLVEALLGSVKMWMERGTRRPQRQY